MSDRVLAGLKLAVTAALAVAVVTLAVTAPPRAEDRAMAIGRQIRCPVCSGESIANSPTQIARDMMGQVRDLIDQGYSDEQVIRQVLAGYGENAQRLDPGLSQSTVALWALPVLALLVGLTVVWSKRRRRSASPTGTG